MYAKNGPRMTWRSRRRRASLVNLDVLVADLDAVVVTALNLVMDV
jgi:hypothetical protein